MLGILNNTFDRTLVQIFLRIKVYNALIPPSPHSLYGKEIWILRKEA